MAINVTSQMTTIDDCESTTDWSVHNRSGTMGALAAIDATDEEVPPKEGTYCLTWDCDIENGGYIHALATTSNYSSKMIYIWIFALNPTGLDTFSAGGIYIIARDTSGNHGYWYVGGRDTYKGGWKCIVADLSRSPNANDGTAPNLANCDAVGVGFKNTVKSKATHNMFIDFMREADVGDGITVLTTSGSIATWADVASGDDSISAGVIRKEGGVFFVQGPITFGSTGTDSCQFDDTSQVIIFEDADVIAGHYEIQVLANTTGTIEFILGDITGGRGISGCTFKTATTTTETPDFTFTNTNIDKLQLYGCSFINCGAINLPPTATNREVISCNFESCEELDPDTCKLQYCFFIQADTYAVLLDKTSHNISNCTFIRGTTGYAFRIPSGATGTYASTNNTYTGYAASGSANAAIYNNSGGSVTITVSGGDAPTYYNIGGSTTTIDATVSVTFDKLKDNTEVRVYKTSDDSVIAGIENATAGSPDDRNFQWSATAGTNVYYHLINKLYEQITVYGYVVPSSATTIDFQQKFDRNYANP